MSVEARAKSLRVGEAFIAKALCCAFDAKSRLGEDPPDIYLKDRNGEVAVEISTLAQYIRDEHGEKPRRSRETPPLRLAEELNNDLRSHMTGDSHFHLIFTLPLNERRKTKSALRAKMLAMLSEPRIEKTRREEILEGNKIEIVLFRYCDPFLRKVTGFARNKVGFNVLEVATDMLERTISRKMKSCAKVLNMQPVWLALLSDGFLADFDGCKRAYEKLQPPHDFEKILLIERDGGVRTIYCRS
jgi:hypothetical protein